MFSRVIQVVAGQAETTDPYSLLVGLGPVGVILFLMIVGKLRTEGEVKRLQEENQAKDKKIEALTESVMGQVIPLMTRVSAVLERVLPDERSK